MQPIAFTAIVASLAALASASPVETRQITEVSLYFYGADDSQNYTQAFPTTGVNINIDNPLVVTHIYNPGGAYCGITGTEGGSWYIPINDHKLDNPQPINGGFCRTI